jgi:hypothetical protein
MSVGVGSAINVNTPGGLVSLTIPPGLSPGQQFNFYAPSAPPQPTPPQPQVPGGAYYAGMGLGMGAMGMGMAPPYHPFGFGSGAGGAGAGAAGAQVGPTGSGPGGQVEHPSDEIVLQESRQIIPVCVVPAAVCRDKAALARVTNALSAVVDELIHRLDRDAIDL